MCELLQELQSLLAEIQAQEFASVEELKGKLENVQDVVNQAIQNHCP